MGKPRLVPLSMQFLGDGRLFRYDPNPCGPRFPLL
jgi:hypothetical protein